jgi:glycosyltransferase involved in cell wall biosynthesis
MIKIIQVASFSGLGGGERVMFDITEALRDDFQFVIVAPPGIFLRKLSELGIRTRELKSKKPIKIIREIRKIIQIEVPDIIHSHGTRAAFWARIAVIGIKNKPKIIYTLHGFHIVRRSFFSRMPLITLERFLNHWTDILVCVSDSDKKLVLKHKTIPESKIIVIKNGVDIKEFQIEQELIKDKKREMGLEDNFIITTIGRLHPPKDFSTILKALKIILAKIKDAKLLIIGDGSLKEPLEKETKELGLNKHVKFLGSREDIPVLINLSDIIILSTNWEGLPLVPLEAGACKKPIIASNVDGVRETIIDGKTGLLFKKSSSEDLAEKILKLFESENLRKKIGESAFYFVSENFNKKRMIEKYKKLYQSTI